MMLHVNRSQASAIRLPCPATPVSERMWDSGGSSISVATEAGQDVADDVPEQKNLE